MRNTDAVLVVVIAAGVFVALQGLLAMRGRRPARPTVFEQPLIAALAPKKQAEVNRVLGRVRLILGIFLIVIGIWAMTI